MQEEIKSGDVRQVLCFFLSDQEYGVEMTDVREVIEPPPITYIPHTPPFISGVINLRGNIIAVLDFRNFLGLGGEGNREEGKRIIVIRAIDVTMGIIVDEISVVREVDFLATDPAPHSISGVDAAYIHGVIQMGDHPLILMDMGEVIKSDRIMELKE